MKDYGKKVWFFPDGDRPPFGDSELKGHESVVVLNPNDRDAHIRVVFYYEDADPDTAEGITIGANRVRCMKTHEEQYFGAHTQSLGRQYAMKVESDVPVIVQYGRLDARQTNLAYYTVMGYGFED